MKKYNKQLIIEVIIQIKPSSNIKELKLRSSKYGILPEIYITKCLKGNTNKSFFIAYTNPTIFPRISHKSITIAVPTAPYLSTNNIFKTTPEKAPSTEPNNTIKSFFIGINA